MSVLCVLAQCLVVLAPQVKLRSCCRPWLCGCLPSAHVRPPALTDPLTRRLTGTGSVTVPGASPALLGRPALALVSTSLVPVVQGNLFHRCWVLALLSGFVTVKISVLCGFVGYFQGGGAQSLVTLLFSRNNGLIFWTETYHDSRVPCQRGTLFGLWIQQEVDDESVWSILKCSGKPWSKWSCLRTAVLRVSRSTRPMWNFLILWEFFFCLPFFYLLPWTL